MSDDVYIEGHEVDVLFKRAAVILQLDWDEICYIFGDTKEKRAAMWEPLQTRLLKIREQHGPSSMVPPAPVISNRRRAIQEQKKRNKK